MMRQNSLVAKSRSAATGLHARLGLLAGLAALGLSLSSCATTTSGSTRLDETGNTLAENGITIAPGDTEPANTSQVLAALKGGLIGRMPGVQVSSSERNRALEAEYKALEIAPAGQTVPWQAGTGLRGQVMAAAPYQVGTQNCRQYSHVLTLTSGQALTQRGAACRNANGTWTPLD